MDQYGRPGSASALWSQWDSSTSTLWFRRARFSQPLAHTGQSPSNIDQFWGHCLSPSSHRLGILQRPFRDDAERRALEHNCSHDCRIVVWFRKSTCGALAVGAHGYGWGWGGTQGEAETSRSILAATPRPTAALFGGYARVDELNTGYAGDALLPFAGTLFAGARITRA